ncbi:MAG: hypothetical protein K0S11_171 [Gammaproteobacteria bacterium]|jgi:hypothetical protein|nr:hypothetical protein [Gammaproteobacteria bacterium]
MEKEQRFIKEPCLTDEQLATVIGGSQNFKAAMQAAGVDLDQALAGPARVLATKNLIN